MKILAIIPARGGSESISRKNIVDVGGKPLIAWTIEAATRSKYIGKTVVSSEDPEILKISRKCGADTVERPKEYSQNNTPMEPVIEDCLSQLLKKNKEFDVLILLQPTSPLRNSQVIDSAFKIFFEKKASALISGYKPQQTPFKSFKISEKGFLEGLLSDKMPFMNRQNFPSAFYSNGAIYIIYVKDFMKTKSLFTQKTIPFLMSLNKSVDVDSMDDIKKINSIIKESRGN